MSACFFVSDLHGSVRRYETLFRLIGEERPDAVFLGGDLLPSHFGYSEPLNALYQDFVRDYLAGNFKALQTRLGSGYPRVFLILGNDDPRLVEASVLDESTKGLWEYVHQRTVKYKDFTVIGYANIPPSPFRLKDWERYDVSRFVDPGCVAPEDGALTVPVDAHELRYGNIKKDLETLTAGLSRSEAAKSLLLCHVPPYKTKLDLANLRGKTIDGVPVDPHIGSIAVRQTIESVQPLLALHGHVHESTRITGNWMDNIGKTVMMSAAHDGSELALVRFDPENPTQATRELI